MVRTRPGGGRWDFYAVRRGWKVGVSTDKDEFKKWTENFDNASYKGFDTLREALHFYFDGPERRFGPQAAFHPPPIPSGVAETMVDVLTPEMSDQENVDALIASLSNDLLPYPQSLTFSQSEGATITAPSTPAINCTLPDMNNGIGRNLGKELESRLRESALPTLPPSTPKRANLNSNTNSGPSTLRGSSSSAGVDERIDYKRHTINGNVFSCSKAPFTEALVDELADEIGFVSPVFDIFGLFMDSFYEEMSRARIINILQRDESVSVLLGRLTGEGMPIRDALFLLSLAKFVSLI